MDRYLYRSTGRASDAQQARAERMYLEAEARAELDADQHYATYLAVRAEKLAADRARGGAQTDFAMNSVRYPRIYRSPRT